MPFKGLTWSRFKEHLRKTAPVYIIGFIICMLLTNLIYTTTRPQTPADREVLVYLVDSYSDPDPLNAYAGDILAFGQTVDETLEEVRFESIQFNDPEQDYTSAYLIMARMSVGDGDVYLASATATDYLLGAQIGLPLEQYLDEGWLTGDEGPIAAVRAVYFAGDTLTHRDFLGALMGCGIKRETVGDIYVSEGSCDFLVTREILPYLLQNFLSAGRTKLHVEQLPNDQIRVPEQKVKAVRDTVSSLRLDGVVSSGFSISRGKAADYIAAGKCELNYAPCMKGDKQAAEGDVITIRGLGKIRLETIGGSTKKGRIAIEITRFL